MIFHQSIKYLILQSLKNDFRLIIKKINFIAICKNEFGLGFRYNLSFIQNEFKVLRRAQYLVAMVLPENLDSSILRENL